MGAGVTGRLGRSVSLGKSVRRRPLALVRRARVGEPGTLLPVGFSRGSESLAPLSLRCLLCKPSTYRLISGTSSQALERENEDHGSDGVIWMVGVVGVTSSSDALASLEKMSPAWSLGEWTSSGSVSSLTLGKAREGAGWLASQGNIFRGAAGRSLGTSYHMFLGGLGYLTGATKGEASLDIS